MAQRADLIRMTSSTGGTGALTLSAQTGWPTFANAFGSSGAVLVDYSIIEFTDSTKTTPARAETGVGSVALSTGVLTRSKILTTWDGTNYRPQAGTATAPAAQNFGTTAANIDVMCSQTSHGGPLLMPFVSGAISGVSDGIGVPPMTAMPASGTVSITAGTTYYWPALIMTPGPFSQAAVRVSTASSGGTPTLSLAIYDQDPSTGLPGRKLIDFGSLGATNNVATIQNTAISTPVDLAPGWYWMGLLHIANSTTGNPALRQTAAVPGAAGIQFGSAGGMNAMLTVTGQTALNDPATAPTGSNNATSLYVPLVGLK